MIKYLLFDFDGTIIDSNDIIIKALKESAYMANGSIPSLDKINEVLGLILIEQMKILVPDNKEVALEYYKTYYRKNMDSLTFLFPEVQETFRILKDNNIKNGIVSNKGINGINHGLNKFKLNEFFDSIISSSDVENTKPHPEGAYKALIELGGEVETALLIGDSPHDIECGKNAGIKTVLVDWTIFPRNRFEKCKPDFIISKFSDILRLCEIL